MALTTSCNINVKNKTEQTQTACSDNQNAEVLVFVYFQGKGGVKLFFPAFICLNVTLGPNV